MRVMPHFISGPQINLNFALGKKKSVCILAPKVEFLVAIFNFRFLASFLRKFPWGNAILHCKKNLDLKFKAEVVAKNFLCTWILHLSCVCGYFSILMVDYKSIDFFGWSLSFHPFFQAHLSKSCLGLVGDLSIYFVGFSGKVPS